MKRLAVAATAVALAAMAIGNKLQAQVPVDSDTLAAIESTDPLSADQVPPVGNFFSAANPSAPPMPANILGYSVWLLGTPNNYLLDDLNSFSSSGMRMMTADSMSPPGFGDTGSGTNDYSYTGSTGFSFDTNGLWLEITNVNMASGYASLNLHNATNQVYEIWSKTNLLSPQWNIEMALWPTDTNSMPFTLPVYTDTFFVWARDWTGITSGGNTVPEWWFWTYFGTTTLSDTNRDSQGNTLLYDYNSRLDPNVITFNMSFDSLYTGANGTSAHLSLTGGIPFYYAVSIDDTNHADAVWTIYSSTNINANLGTTEGWHQVYLGLRGFLPNSSQAWQSMRLKLDLTPPQIAITNLSSGTVTEPIIQLQGYSPEALENISYDVNNAAGIITNQSAFVLSEFYDTNTMEFTTNYFQCFDVSLTNGINTVTVHATDLAGNITVTNFYVTLDYSGATNPPNVQLTWPQAGTKISGNSFTWRGKISDPTAQVVAQIIDTNGVTNSVTGRVGRDGDFWVQNLPLSGGTNNLFLTATDSAGNVSVTNIPVIQSSVILTITSAGLGQPVTGTISDTNYTVWVNGIKATNNMDGTWTASDPHLTVDTPAVQVRAIPNSDNGGNGGGQ